MSLIDDYLKNVTEPQKSQLERVRTIIKDLLPGAEEVISYGMPGFKYHGKYVIGFAAFKDHLSLFPTAEPIEVLKDRLKDYKLAKGTIQFTVDTPVPQEIIEELVKIRLTSIG